MSKTETAKRLQKQFEEDRNEFSLSVAWARLIRDLPLPFWKLRRTHYEKTVLRYLKKRYLPIIKECIEKHDIQSEHKCEEKHIWVMWWQGEDAMPPIIKACYSRLLKSSSFYVITLITKDNYSDYVNIPQHILNKLYEGKISITHFSDVLRVLLLSTYGGVWADATLYVHTWPKEFFENNFYTIHAPNLFPEFISRGSWSTFCLAANRTNHLLMTTLFDLFFKYWEEHNCVIDYLLFDYFITMILGCSDYLTKEIDKMPVNLFFYELHESINDPFSESSFSEMMAKSPLQKLTYKADFSFYDDQHNLTNYGYLLSQENIAR